MRTPAKLTRPKPRVSKPYVFAAPKRGWIANENMATALPEGAWTLENFFPTPTGARMRGGSQKYAQVGGVYPTGSLATYKNGNAEHFFATHETALFEITTVADPDVSPPPSYTGFTGGDWSWLQFENTGGVYLIGVNGENDGVIFDGVNWYPVSTNATYRLNYDAQTVNFVQGTVVTGGTSGATATIYRDIDNGTTGYLLLVGITGTFQDNEALTAVPGAAVANGVATLVSGAVTGVNPQDLTYLASHNERIWAIKKNSLDAYYFDPLAIGGAATKFPLGGIFKRGGSLLFIAEWSLDDGGGIATTLAFFTTEGEVAVYGGLNPDDATSWTIRGRYRVGKPMGKDAWVSAGGDVLVATDIGLIPLSQAVNRDPAALSLVAVSSPIEAEWSKAVAGRQSRPWMIESWPTKQMLLVAFPPADDSTAGMFVVNLLTGAWAPFTAWDGRCLKLFGSRMFWGTDAGSVVEAEVTGADQGTPYTSVFVPLFDDVGAPAALKIMSLARAVYRAPFEANPRLSGQADFTVALPSAPDASPSAQTGIWDAGVWGSSVWSQTGARSTFQRWQSVSGVGYSIAPALQITSGGLSAPELDLVRLDVMFTTGDAVS